MFLTNQWNIRNNSVNNSVKRNGQWTTLCPFCSSETVAKIEIFGGMIPSEFEKDLNKFMSFTMMNSNGISRNVSNNNSSKDDNNNKDKLKSLRKTFNLFGYERLHERIQRIVRNAYPYYPTTKLPYSFPKLTPHDNRDNKPLKNQDRAIKIIRSKEELFWNIFFYFQLLGLPTKFLFGGMYEFQSQTTTSPTLNRKNTAFDEQKEGIVRGIVRRSSQSGNIIGANSSLSNSSYYLILGYDHF